MRGAQRRGNPLPLNQVYNVAVGDRTTLNDLFRTLRDSLASHVIASEARQSIAEAQPQYREFRAGDVRHSQADIGKAERMLCYAPSTALAQGTSKAVHWYVLKMMSDSVNMVIRD